MNKAVSILFIVLLCFSGAARADENLDSLKKNLAVEQKKKVSLQREAESIESAIGETRSKLLHTGKSIQGNEKDLKNLESRISELESKKKTIDGSLNQDRQSIARLILALERLRRVPTEALIAKPGAPLQAAQSALLMHEIIPALYDKAEKLRLNLADLEKISADLKSKREKALATSQDLMAQHRELSELVDKREQLYASVTGDLKERQDIVARISQQAENLQDLVKRLNEDNKTRKSSKSASLHLPKPGQARLPVSGYVKVRYGEPDNFGAPSRGLTIESVDQAVVVAPMGGVVRFAGSFKNYGQMIILEHENGYHSLIAGLQKIDTVVGQSVAAGEPLGLLGRASNGNKPALYYELRLNGQPTNPAGKFTDLG